MRLPKPRRALRVRGVEGALKTKLPLLAIPLFLRFHGAISAQKYSAGAPLSHSFRNLLRSVLLVLQATRRHLRSARRGKTPERRRELQDVLLRIQILSQALEALVLAPQAN